MLKQKVPSSAMLSMMAGLLVSQFLTWHLLPGGAYIGATIGVVFGYAVWWCVTYAVAGRQYRPPPPGARPQAAPDRRPGRHEGICSSGFLPGPLRASPT